MRVVGIYFAARRDTLKRTNSGLLSSLEQPTGADGAQRKEEL